MTDKYRRFKLVQEMTSDELNTAKENEFDFNENVLGAFVPLDQVIYTEIPENCKPDVFPTSYRNGNCRADGVCDGFIDEKGEVYISCSEMDIGICMEWELSSNP